MVNKEERIAQLTKASTKIMQEIERLKKQFETAKSSWEVYSAQFSNHQSKLDFFYLPTMGDLASGDEGITEYKDDFSGIHQSLSTFQAESKIIQTEIPRFLEKNEDLWDKLIKEINEYVNNKIKQIKRE